MVQFLVIQPILIEFLLILVHLFLLFFNIFLLLLHLFPYHSCSFSLTHPLPLPFTSLPPPLIKPLLPSSLLSPNLFICTVCHLLFSLSLRPLFLPPISSPRSSPFLSHLLPSISSSSTPGSEGCARNCALQLHCKIRKSIGLPRQRIL